MEVLPDDGPGVDHTSRQRLSETQYSDDQMLAALRRIASTLDSASVSMTAYQQQMRPGDPAVITIIRRFGTWKKACAAAGLRPNHDSKHREPRLDRSQALDAVAAAAHAYSTETGHRPHTLTQSWYMHWRAAHPGQRALGLSWLGKRYGAWSEVKAAALGCDPTTGRAE